MGRRASVCALLNAERARYLVVGGYAVGLHGVVRATKDIGRPGRLTKRIEGITRRRHQRGPSAARGQ